MTKQDELVHDNVVMLPQTVKYYEDQLASYFKVERYEQAAGLLAHLLQFSNVDPAKRDEWEMLLVWLQTMFPEVMFAPLDSSNLERNGEFEEMEEDEPSEEELRRQAIDTRVQQEQGYIDNLLQVFKEESYSPQEQLIALEKLAFVHHSDAPNILMHWLTAEVRHPLLQFRALQALKIWELQGEIRVPKLGGDVHLRIEDTPLGSEEMPASIRDIFQQLRVSSEEKYPDLAQFSTQIEREFAAFAYGTELYEEMAQVSADRTQLWASALQDVLQELIFKMPVVSMDIYDQGLHEQDEKEWERIRSLLGQFFTEQFPPHS
ncbi:hypothetical protein NV379_16175 [Paenibacillus sp. N1-5-1-14]|uniref:hypothetical protein n=1 Tax=Paenibacillus radicibacter TaxID=2972488 RepID=UPI00215923F8|nr:hypothetical protein [Paenibacillus radicibacter]MCR8644192.1 hypothetical protein [Paenibacillus radicibacter]